MLRLFDDPFEDKFFSRITDNFENSINKHFAKLHKNFFNFDSDFLEDNSTNENSMEIEEEIQGKEQNDKSSETKERQNNHKEERQRNKRQIKKTKSDTKLKEQEYEMDKKEKQIKNNQRILQTKPFDLFEKSFFDNEEEFDTNKFSSIHQKVLEKSQKNSPLTYISNSYSSVQTIDQDGKVKKNVKESKNVTLRDEKGKVITKRAQRINNDNQDETIVEEKIFNDKGYKRIKRNGNEKEEFVTHNLQENQIENFDQKWSKSDKKNRLTQKLENFFDFNSSRKALL